MYKENFTKARTEYSLNKIKEAMHTYSKADQGNDPEFQCKLACMYLKGEIFPRDFEEAVKWFERAANQGSAKAQVSLGILYKEGKGVARDDRKAARLWEKAAVQGNLHAQDYLGYAHWAGNGVAQDKVEAVKQWTLSTLGDIYRHYLYIRKTIAILSGELREIFHLLILSVFSDHAKSSFSHKASDTNCEEIEPDENVSMSASSQNEESPASNIQSEPRSSAKGGFFDGSDDMGYVHFIERIIKLWILEQEEQRRACNQH